MILVHLIVGMICGTFAAIVLWLMGDPFWVMIASYSLAGSTGTTVSALIGPLWIWLRKYRGYKRESDPSAHEMSVGEAQSRLGCNSKLGFRTYPQKEVKPKLA